MLSGGQILTGLHVRNRLLVNNTDSAPAMKLGEKPNLEKDLEDNSIGSLNPGASIPVSVESNDSHTGLTQEMNDLVLSDNTLTLLDNLVSPDQEDSRLEDENTINTNIDTFVDEEKSKNQCAIVNATFNHRSPLLSLVCRPDSINSPNVKEKELELFTGNKRTLDSRRTLELNKSLVWEEEFAEVLLEDEWVKVEIVSRERFAKGVYLAQRIDNCGHRFWWKLRGLLVLGRMTLKVNMKPGSA